MGGRAWQGGVNRTFLGFVFTGGSQASKICAYPPTASAVSKETNKTKAQ